MNLKGYEGSIEKYQRKEIIAMFARKGQGLVEYAFILVLVAIVVIAALAILGPAVGSTFSRVVTSI
jgi:pilus assembly protein Flp/PilA